MPSKKKSSDQKQKQKRSSTVKFSEELNNYNALREVIENQYINRMQIKPTSPATFKHFQIA